MNQDLSIIELVLHASIVVKIVIAGLLLMSLFSWGLIFSKLGSLGKIKRRNETFEADFWSGKFPGTTFEGENADCSTSAK